MLKFILLLAFMSLAAAQSVTIDCSFITNRYYTIGQTYLCKVTKDPNIRFTSTIRSINGTHQVRKFSHDVIGFTAISKTIFYFPQNLTKFFKNIKLISILSCQLRRIRQHDLMDFPDLKYLNLGGNSIQILQKNLFDCNPQLELVGFDDNRIFHVHPKTFDNLRNLRFFWWELLEGFKKFESDGKSKEIVQHEWKI